MQAKHCSKLGDFFLKRSEPGFPDLPTMSVTINNGLVRRSSIDRKTDTELAPDHHLLIREGDIAYNMMRMWQGASGRADHDGIVSPAYVVLSPTEMIDSLFASYWFKSPRMIYLFWAYSYGLTTDRLRLYFKDFAKIPAEPPILPEQKKIAEILFTWDRAIEQTKKLIEAKKKLKKGLMQQLLTGKRRFPGFSKPWEEVRLGQVGIFSKGAGVSKSDLVSQGYPAIRYGELYTTHHVQIKSIRSFIDSDGKHKSKKIKYGDILFAGSGETADEIGKSAVFLDTFETYAGGDVIIFSPSENAPLFLALVLNASTVRKYLRSHGQGQSVVHIYKTDLDQLPLYLPSLDEQNRIATMLSALTNDIELNEEISRRYSDEKRGLMQKLLTGRCRVISTEENHRTERTK